MTPDDIAKLTLGELEAIAVRLEHAVGVIRDAQRILGGAVATQPASANPLSATVPPALTPYEVAQREALLARNREALPDAIKRAEGIS